jgi:hypothetical protein
MSTTQKPLTPQQQERREKLRLAFISRLPQTLQVSPTVELLLADGPHTLEVDNQAMIDFEKDTGINLLGAGMSKDDIGNPKVIGHLLHRAAQRHQKEATLEWANGIINIRHFLYIRECLYNCLELAMPDLSDIKLTDDDAPKDTGELDPH